MFIVFLRFSGNKARAAELMAGHKQWIQSGFDDGVFLLLGNLDNGQGGGIVAHGVTLADLRARVDRDPFVAHDVVRAEIVEITPSRTDARLQFLLRTDP